MTLTKEGQTISLDNENHIAAFISSGWAEVKSPAPAAEVIPEEIPEAAKVEEQTEKKPVGRKKQEK